jgi:flavin-dependent dehydrogenase
MNFSVFLGAAALAIGLGIAGSSFAQSAASNDAVKIDEVKIGSPVFGTDGIKVGEINRIKAEADGRVTEIQVTTGGPAGLNAPVVSITPDKIATRDGSDVKLSLSAAEAKTLPVLGDDQKG